MKVGKGRSWSQLDIRLNNFLGLYSSFHLLLFIFLLTTTDWKATQEEGTKSTFTATWICRENGNCLKKIVYNQIAFSKIYAGRPECNKTLTHHTHTHTHTHTPHQAEHPITHTPHQAGQSNITHIQMHIWTMEHHTAMTND